MRDSFRRSATISAVRWTKTRTARAADNGWLGEQHTGVEASSAIQVIAPEQADMLDTARQGAIRALIDMLAFAKPQAFGRAQRIAHIVQEIAPELGIEKHWDVDVAGLLAQLATVNLPAATLDKLDRGMPLSSDERLTMARVPGMSAQLLTHVPGLEVLSGAIAASGNAVMARGQAEKANEHDASAALPAMIRLAGDFDYLCRGRVPVITAIAQLRRRDLYDERVLDALERAYLPKAPDDEPAPTEVAVDELEPGMVMAIDVTTPEEVLLVSVGATITNAMIRRLSNFAQRGECADRVLVMAGSGDAQ